MQMSGVVRTIGLMVLPFLTVVLGTMIWFVRYKGLAEGWLLATLLIYPVAISVLVWALRGAMTPLWIMLGFGFFVGIALVLSYRYVFPQ